MENKEDSRPMKKLSDDIIAALTNCADALSIDEFSRVTGVRIELLRRFITRQARQVRLETWDKIYPTLKPYLTAPAPPDSIPVRIGPTYRRHHELIEMFSDQKVLLDEFAVLTDLQQNQVVKDFMTVAGDNIPTEFSSLSILENQLMGAFLSMSEEQRKNKLSELTAMAIEEIRHRRKDMF